MAYINIISLQETSVLYRKKNTASKNKEIYWVLKLNKIYVIFYECMHIERTHIYLF